MVGREGIVLRTLFFFGVFYVFWCFCWDFVWCLGSRLWFLGSFCIFFVLIMIFIFFKGCLKKKWGEWVGEEEEEVI